MRKFSILFLVFSVIFASCSQLQTVNAAGDRGGVYLTIDGEQILSRIVAGENQVPYTIVFKLISEDNIIETTKIKGTYSELNKTFKIKAPKVNETVAIVCDVIYAEGIPGGDEIIFYNEEPEFIKIKNGKNKVSINMEKAYSVTQRERETFNNAALTTFCRDNNISLSNITEFAIPYGYSKIEETSTSSIFGSSSADIKRVIIPETVTSIANYSFYNCESLASVTLHQNIGEIGKYAFYKCGFTNITIPKNIVDIGDGAFSFCSNLKSVNMLNPNPATLGVRAFAEVAGGFVVFVPSKEAAWAYQNANNWSDYQIGLNANLGAFTKNDFESIPDYLNVKTYKIPYGYTSIGESAFSFFIYDRPNDKYIGLTEIETVEIPTSVNKIGYSSFSHCEKLASIIIPESVTSIGEFAFSDCTSLTSVTIPSGVTSIEGCVFVRCTKLGTITFEGNIKTIGEEAFADCTELGSITIPDSVTSIGEKAFLKCTSLESVTIPSGVTSIGGWAFQKCSKLASVTMQSTTPPKLGESVFVLCNDNLKIYVPSSAVDAYKNAPGWSNYKDKIKAKP